MVTLMEWWWEREDEDLLRETMSTVSPFSLTMVDCIILYQSAVISSPTLICLGNKGCGVWVMSSSLPQLLGNYIVHNCMYGLAVFCRKDPDNIEAREGNWPIQEGVGGDIGNGERRGVEGEAREGQENFNEEGELFAWESDLDSEDERHSARRSVSVALMEGNCVSYNGGTKLCFKRCMYS